MEDAPLAAAKQKKTADGWDTIEIDECKHDVRTVTPVDEHTGHGSASWSPNGTKSSTLQMQRITLHLGPSDHQ